MRYVLDSSVAFKWVVVERDSDKVDRLRADVLAGIHALLAPDVLPVELAHALTRAERQGRIAVGEARLFWADVMTTQADLFPSVPLTARAIQIASAARVGVYDCVYVALAEREGCDLVTADARLLANLRPRFPFLTDLAGL